MLGVRTLLRRTQFRLGGSAGRRVCLAQSLSSYELQGQGSYESTSRFPLCRQHVCHSPDTNVNRHRLPPPSTSDFRLIPGLVIAAFSSLGLVLCQEQQQQEQQQQEQGCETEDNEEETEIENWSSTHSVKTKAYLQPESAKEVEDIIREAQKKQKRVRVVGNALSPNGIGLSEDTMLSLGQCDRVLHIDQEMKTVTIEAGARVQQVVDALAPHGLTLQNYASINEQQLGGFLQVGAHGTGAAIPPVDEQVVAMKLVTPQLGTIELSNERFPKLFRMTKVGLGALGVVTEVTIKCVERHMLQETTSVMTRAEVKANHYALLQDNKHVRYMWIPYTDTVVVVCCNPLETQPAAREEKPTCHEEDSLEPLKSLLLRKLGPGASAADLEGIDSLNFAGLRGKLLDEAPLDVEWIKQVNAAEAEFWRRSQGTRVDYSDKVLAFECGGQQWVNEVCFPVGTLKEPNNKDIDYMTELLRLIEEEGVAAPAPIEQRWTSSSSAKMSPAHDPASSETLFSWVGVIMYLSAEDPEARKRVTDAFLSYRDLCKARLWDRYDCVIHWAKLEKPRSEEEAIDTTARLRRRFPISDFNTVRGLLDPSNIMANDYIDASLGRQ